ncbi:SEC-C domain-containing protein [Paraclostridium sp. AKS73]|nr:SEC-C domain-containing protein [Paraclostridium sp. AKS73]
MQEDTVRYLYNFTIEEPIQRKQVVDVEKISSNADEGQGNRPVKKDEEIGRNDECPCGSGKKYKKCCGR